MIYCPPVSLRFGTLTAGIYLSLLRTLWLFRLSQWECSAGGSECIPLAQFPLLSPWWYSAAHDWFNRSALFLSGCVQLPLCCAVWYRRGFERGEVGQISMSTQSVGDSTTSRPAFEQNYLSPTHWSALSVFKHTHFPFFLSLLRFFLVATHWTQTYGTRQRLETLHWVTRELCSRLTTTKCYSSQESLQGSTLISLMDPSTLEAIPPSIQFKYVCIQIK